MNTDREEEKNNRKRIATDDIDGMIPSKRPALDFKCSIPNCDFCNNGVSVLMKYEMRKQGWKQRLVIAFNSLEKSGISKGGWHSLTGEIYPFLETHWQHLWSGIEKEMEANWRKKVQDCLTHNKDMFESGVTMLGKKGYWRMAVHETAKPKISVDKSPKSPISDSSLTSSPISNSPDFSSENKSADIVSIINTLQKQENISEESNDSPKDKRGKNSDSLKNSNSSTKNRRSLLTQEDIALLQTLVKSKVIAPVTTNNIPIVTEQPKSQFSAPQVVTQKIAPTLPTNIQPTVSTPLVQTPIPQTPIPVIVAPVMAPPAPVQPAANEPQTWGCEFKNFLSRSGIRKRSFDVTHLVGKNGSLSSLPRVQL